MSQATRQEIDIIRRRLEALTEKVRRTPQLLDGQTLLAIDQLGADVDRLKHSAARARTNRQKALLP